MDTSRKHLLCMLLIVVALTTVMRMPTHAEEKISLPQDEGEYADRRLLFEGMSALTGLPWPYLAAVDQYERSLNLALPTKRPQTKSEGVLAIRFSDRQWSGDFNPNSDETDPDVIRFFGGIGLDGDGDGKAERTNDIDLLYTMARVIGKHGTGRLDVQRAVWDFYQTTNSAPRIMQFADIFAHFDRLNLFYKVFPLPISADYSYRSTWGAGRSYGGYRIHEGTDIFARYGVPVRSTCYGMIEVKGWNRYGGWRIGIRDLNGVYHYYAHLSGYNQQFSSGDIVQPGDTIGWVGSSGYGKPGTQGKFPPHLHYGLYRDAGYTEWSFDPFPYLKKWERDERKARQKRGRG